MRIVAFITQAAVIDQSLAHRATTAYTRPTPIEFSVQCVAAVAMMMTKIRVSG